MDFHTLTRRELQTLCKKNGIPANITNVAMADALTALLTTVQGIEELSDCSQSVTAQSSVESPERAEVTSPRVPRTRTARKKVENATVVNKTMSTTRRLTRNLNRGYDAKKEDTEAPINIDVQFSEVDKQSEIGKGKEACIPQTPSMVSDTRKRSSRAESTARKAYGTRQSTRLAVKTSEDTDTNVENKEKPDAANMKLFSADCGDNFEMNAKECCADLSQDAQSTVSHLKEEASETSKCEEITSSYSGNDLGCDSPKDSYKSAGKVKTDEENGIQGNIWNEENKGDDINEQAEVENKDEVIGENGDDISEQPEVENKDEVMGENGDDINEQAEVEIKDEVTGDNGDGITKQPDTEINIKVTAETQDFNGESVKLNGNGEVVTGDEVCGVVINVNDDNGDLVSEMKDMSLTSNDDMITQTEDHDGENLAPEMSDMVVETEDHAVSDAIVVDEFVPMSEEEEKDLVKVTAGEHVDNSGCGDIPSQDNSNYDEFSPKLEEEKEEHDLVKVAVGEQLVNGDSDKPSQENSKDDEVLLKSFSSEEESSEEESSEESSEESEEEEEEDLVNVYKPSQEKPKSFSLEESSEEESEDESEDESEEEESEEEEEEEDLVNVYKPSQEKPKSFSLEESSEEESEDESEEEDEVEDLVKVAAGEQLDKPTEENSKEDASNKATIFVDNEDSILLSATTAPPTPGKKKSATSLDNPNAVLVVGKENKDKYSLRKLRKMVKELDINANNKNDKKESSVKTFDEEVVETASKRPALQMLPENQI